MGTATAPDAAGGAVVGLPQPANSSAKAQARPTTGVFGGSNTTLAVAAVTGLRGFSGGQGHVGLPKRRITVEG